MLITEQGIVERAEDYSSELQCDKIDENKIGDQGCQHLSKVQWKNIKEFYISTLLRIRK